MSWLLKPGTELNGTSCYFSSFHTNFNLGLGIPKLLVSRTGYNKASRWNEPKLMQSSVVFWVFVTTNCMVGNLML